MSCEALGLAYPLFAFLLAVIAVVILVVLVCNTHRKNLCLECCWGRPGLFTPVDLLHRGPHRLIYAAIFGLMSDQFLSIALLGAGNVCTLGNPYGQALCNTVLSKVLVVMILCLLYGPVFACVNTPKPLLGHITGLIYLILLIVTFELENGLLYSNCEAGETETEETEGDRVDTALSVLSDLPSYVFYVILLVWYVYEIANDVHIKRTGRGILFTHEKNGHLFKYTASLLMKKTPIQGRWQKLKSFFWAYDKDFRFPLKFLAPVVVMLSIIFKLFIVVVRLSYLVASLEDTWKSFITDITDNSDVCVLELRAIRGLSAMITISGIISILLCLFLLFQMVATVHKHLKLAAQGKFKFYSKTPYTHTRILVNSLKYSGYQIGYFVWAWFIIWILSLSVGVLIGAVVIGLICFPDYTGPKLFSFFLTVVWLPVVLIAHKVMCKYVFLERDSGGKFLAITNRNGFSWFSYFALFYNAIVGFVGAIIRILLSLLFGTLLLFRLDQNIMIRGFEFADWGHKTYLGFLYVEHTYNNPVANTFVALLTGPRQDLKEVMNRRIRNRWLVAYTLINNPSLRPLRAPQLQEQQSQRETFMEEHYQKEHYQKEEEAMAEGNVYYEEVLSTVVL